MTTMKAAVCNAPHELSIERVDKPEAREGEVVVRVKATGVCGSDVDGYLGQHPWIESPIILGHECSGVVEATGDGVKGVKTGDRVVVEPLLSCGECPNCLRGYYNRCRDVQVLGHQLAGTFAEYVRTEERFIHGIPEGVDFGTAALAEPISGALHGVGRCDLNIGDEVVVMGCGTIGFFLAQHAVNSGANVTIIEPERRKRQAALEAGIDRAIDPEQQNPQELISEITDGVGADCVMEAVGIPETIKRCVGLTRKGGKLLLMGWTGRATDAFDCTTVTLDEMTVLGTMGFAFDFPVALDLLSREAIEAERIITHRFALEDAEEALKLLHEKRDGVWKATLEFE
ncbi:MAG: zinc-dependent alcohol dehydrogenase [Planctomycetota bacterium]